jgi:hypothetical protein
LYLDDKILEIETRRNDDKLSELRLLLITPNRWLRVYNKRIEKYASNTELHFVRGLHPYRGEILNFFAKLEFLANELILVSF